jgi:hypothetical protein
MERVFFVTNSTERVKEQQLRLVESASAAGVRRVVYLSQLHSAKVSPVRFLRYHADTSMGWILNGLSFGEASRTILFAALRCQFLQYAVNPRNNLFEFYQFSRLFFTRQDRGCDFAA